MLEYRLKKAAKYWEEFPERIIYVGVELSGVTPIHTLIADSYRDLFDQLYDDLRLDKEQMNEDEYRWQMDRLIGEGLSEEEAEQAIDEGKADSVDWTEGWKEEDYLQAVKEYTTDSERRIMTVEEALSL